jgi:sarcosine oxidase subunit gamma
VTSISAFQGQAEEVAGRIEQAWGLRPASALRRVSGGETAVIWSGPGRWLMTYPRGRAEAEATAAALAGRAAVVDVGNALVVLEVRGPSCREVLAKGVTVDLHPRAFGIGHVAMTSVAHMPVHLWQEADDPAFGLAVPRSYAVAFWDWLVHASAEHGLDVATLAPPA